MHDIILDYTRYVNGDNSLSVCVDTNDDKWDENFPDTCSFIKVVENLIYGYNGIVIDPGNKEGEFN